MPALTVEQAVADRNLRPVLIAWAKRVHALDSAGFVVDMIDHRPAKYLYERYIAYDSPLEINLTKALRKSMEAQALLGDPGFAQMGPNLVTAADLMLIDLKRTFDHGTDAFLTSKEYQTHLSAGLTRDPLVARVLTGLKLSSAKAASLKPFVEVYLKARTLDDALAAYVAMQKLVAKSKLDPALAAAGKPSADLERRAKEEKLRLENADRIKRLVEQADAFLPAITTDLEETNSWFTRMLAKLKTGPKPTSSEGSSLFQAGRLRMAKLDKNYLKAITTDKTFTTRHKALAGGKKEVDGLWGTFKKALGK